MSDRTIVQIACGLFIGIGAGVIGDSFPEVIAIIMIALGTANLASWQYKDQKA